MDKLLSIIMPVYNAEKFLDKSISSVLNQDYQNIELILVNDGSKDDSLKVCKKYAEQDTRVVVIDQKNTGIAGARNTGIDASKGEYVTFIDDDDWVDNDIYTYLIDILENSDVIFAECGINIVYSNGGVPYASNDAKYCDVKETLNLFFSDKELFKWTVWNKIFRKSAIEGIRFKDGLAEDMRFDLEVFDKNGGTYFSSDVPKYNWNRLDYVSESRRSFNQTRCTYIDFFLEYEQIAKKHELYELADKCYAEAVSRVLSYSARTNKVKFKNYKYYIDKWKKFARNNFNKTLKCKNLSSKIKLDYFCFCIFPGLMNKINTKFIRLY